MGGSSLRFLALLLALILAACAAPAPVRAPPSAEEPDQPEAEVFLLAADEVRDPYLRFLNLSPSELWSAIDQGSFWEIPLEPPEDYYVQVDDSSPLALRESLHSTIRGHTVYQYTTPSLPGDPNHRVDTWDIVALADAHPEDPSMVLDIYLNATFPRQLTGPGPSVPHRYDREHSWPKSLGFDANRLTNPPYSDVHHIFAAYHRYNNSRGNNPYGGLEPSDPARRPTRENLGVGGSLTDEPDSSNYSSGGIWQTWFGRRGDVARAMFYMDIRYEGDLFGATSEPNLELTDDPALVVSADVWTSGEVAFMGLLGTLLEWHEQDPVDDIERRRNTVVYLFQGNRNPFVDHPEWVWAVYGGEVAPTN